MNNLKKLQNQLKDVPYIITDTTMIFYFTGVRYDVGERMIALLVTRHQPPILFLNRLFVAPANIECIYFEDGDNTTQLIVDRLTTSTIAIDGNCPLRFALPFIDRGFDVVSASPLLESIRSIKDEDEIKKLVEASAYNDKIMASLFDYIKVGMTEKEIANHILTLQCMSPSTGPSFEPIVLFSENAADPHGLPSDRILKPGDLVLIDMGGICNDYCSDMTRCFIVGENPEFEAIYTLARQANEAAIAHIKPGVTFAEIDEAARSVIRNAGYGDAFVHRTGHGIGIECHENLDVSSKNEQEVTVGMCFSIEPGIYLPGFLGVRVEDLVTVTENGVQVLNHFTKSIEDLKLNTSQH